MCLDIHTRSERGKDKREETTNDIKARTHYSENIWTCKGMTMNEMRCRKLDGIHPIIMLYRLQTSMRKQINNLSVWKREGQPRRSVAHTHEHT